ncbi:MAG: protein kinase [Peptococcaceae bacterium]|nr:protein kinase [Peptococcaceae bacterium]
MADIQQKADMKLKCDKFLTDSIKHFQSPTGKWQVDSLIGVGSFGKVYKIRRQEFGKTFDSAIKIISIPYDDTEIRQMRSEGLNEASIQEALQSLVTDIINEIEIMRGFRGTSNIVNYEDHKVVEKPGGIGWDIMIRMELLQSLSGQTTGIPLPTEEVVKLGIHMCKALELCAKKNIIHRDIKPDNIFISKHGDYKLGDFGIARQIERTMSGLTKKGTYSYMAPEVYKGDKYGPGVDIYSLGVVMYTLLNKNRGPFLPDYPMKIMPGDRDRALDQRMGGEPFPVLKEVSPELNALLQKACAYDRDQRFADPAEMGEALMSIQAAGKKEKRPTERGAGHIAGQTMEQASRAPLGRAMYTILGQEKGGKGINTAASEQGPAQTPKLTDIMPFQAEPEAREEPADPRESLAARTDMDTDTDTDTNTEDRPKSRSKSKKKRLLIPGLALSAVVLLLAIGWAGYYTQRDLSNSPSSPWPAVNFFLNGQEEQGGQEDEGALEHITDENEQNVEGGSANGGIGAATDSIPSAEESIVKDGVTQYAVSYNHAENGGASATKATAYFTGKVEVDLTPTATKGNGWEFIGWNTDKNATAGLKTLTMPETGVVLYAIYKKVLTATFNDYSGTAPSTRTASVTIYNKANSGSITVPAQNTYTGWTARGWSTAAAAKADVMVSSGPYAISADTVFYGLYQQTITLSYAGKSGLALIKKWPDNQTKTRYTNSSAITNCANPSFVVGDVKYSNKNLIFGGWTTDPMRKSPLYKPGAKISLTADTTLNAIWNL